MKFYTKILALVLALVTVLSVFAACGDGKGTETDPEVTETETVTETESETEKRPQRETEAKPELPPGVLMSFDFESTDSLYRYFKRFGVSLNSALAGGILQDGRWNYQGSALAFKDDFGIYDLNAYSVEFDFCFNSFVNKDNTSVFTFITDNDGVLGGDSNFYALKMDKDGFLYNYNVKPTGVKVEKGKVYHIKYEVNRTTNMVDIFLNNEFWTSAGYSQKNNNYNCFRFMDQDRGAEMWIDNFVIEDRTNAKEKAEDGIVYAVEAAYVRGGSHAGTPQKLADGMYVDIKYHSSSLEVYREGLLKFDISSLTPGSVKYTMFQGNYVNMGADRTFDVYWVDSDWDSDTVNFNNRPMGKLIIKNVSFGGKGAPLELSTFIEEALAKGDTMFSIRLVPKSQIGDGQTRIMFTGSDKPFIMVLNEKPEKNHFQKLVEDEEKNAAIWAWAQQMYDEWYARYQALPAVNADAERIVSDSSQYTKITYASQHSTDYQFGKKQHKSRPFSALTDLDKYVSDPFKNAKLDAYGGIMIEELKQKATGFFYTTKINGRWWMVDPLGYPYINIGLSQIDYSLNGSTMQRENALKKFGSFENWALATTRQVRDELNFNSSFSPRVEIRNVADGLSYMAHMGIMSNYGLAKGVRGVGNGSTVFTENNTMPVFDPDFVSYANFFVKDSLKDLNNPRIIGYTSDNELPMDVSMLDNSLTVNHLKSANHYTYACAWTWLANITGKEDPSLADVTSELRDLFRGFVYDRYFNVVTGAFDAANSPYMYMGCRFLTVSKDSQWVYRFAAPYLDCMTINWYFEWEPSIASIYGIEKNGDMPFLVTEFYSKAGDSGLGNTSGAGFYVATQADRADFYETFTIRLMESRNCVGWQLFHYMDNDPNSGTSDKSSVDSNKGIFNNEYEMYTVFTDRIAILNENVYKIVDYFQNK